MKVSCTVWSRGKDGDNIKVLPIAIVADRIPEIMLGVNIPSEYLSNGSQQIVVRMLSSSTQRKF